jgi:hypothetical protein
MSTIILIILAPLLTYSLRITGIIAALILSHLVGTMYGLYKAKKSHEIKIDTKMITRVYLVVLVPALPILIVKEMFAYSNIPIMILGAATYFVIYLLLIPITGTITPTELKEIKKILEKIKLLNYLAKPFLYFEEKIFKFFSRTNPT